MPDEILIKVVPEDGPGSFTKGGIHERPGAWPAPPVEILQSMVNGQPAQQQQSLPSERAPTPAISSSSDSTE